MYWLYVYVYSAATGLAITNATFGYVYTFLNQGGGWYAVAVYPDSAYYIGASGYNTTWANSDGWSYWYQPLSVYTPPPPPPPPSNCWS